MSKQRGLGRGFESLIPTEVEVQEGVAAGTRDEVLQADPALIDPNPHQPRRHFNPEELQELAESIKHHGILQPLVVSQKEDGRYELVAGERRLRASRLAGLDKVPAILRSYGEQQKLELALIENVQRSQLNPIEAAVAYSRLMEEFNLNLSEVGKRVGKAGPTISNAIRLLQLPADIQQAIADGRISEAHGRSLLAISDPGQRQQCFEGILNQGWTVRQAEDFARGAKDQNNSASGKGGRPSRPAPVSSHVTRTLEEYLGAKVSLQPSGKGGRLVVEYYSDEELQRIFETITGDQEEV